MEVSSLCQRYPNIGEAHNLPKVPASHVKGPFSVRRPERELQPGPPLNHMVISSEAFGLLEGKNLRRLH